MNRTSHLGTAAVLACDALKRGDRARWSIVTIASPAAPKRFRKPIFGSRMRRGRAAVVFTVTGSRPNSLERTDMVKGLVELAKFVLSTARDHGCDGGYR